MAAVIALAFLLLLFTGHLSAQEATTIETDSDIEETITKQKDTVISQAATVPNLYYKQQQIENEVQALTGRIEELEYQLQYLTHRLEEVYIDLDRRILNVGNKAQIASDAIATAPDDTEAGMYRNAFQLLQDKSYSQAGETFEAFISRYPNAERVPDALYWVGEINLEKGPPFLEKARQQFMQMVRQYPDHSKTPEALYKLAYIYHQLGDTSQALEYLDRVINDYPNDTAAKLAGQLADELR